MPSASEPTFPASKSAPARNIAAVGVPLRAASEIDGSMFEVGPISVFGAIGYVVERQGISLAPAAPTDPGRRRATRFSPFRDDRSE
jgi:hypothetical protein